MVEDVENKCYGCQERKLRCHSSCKHYLAYKKHLEQIKEKQRNENLYHDYQAEKRERFLSSHKKLRGKK